MSLEELRRLSPSRLRRELNRKWRRADRLMSKSTDPLVKELWDEIQQLRALVPKSSSTAAPGDKRSRR